MAIQHPAEPEFQIHGRKHAAQGTRDAADSTRDNLARLDDELSLAVSSDRVNLYKTILVRVAFLMKFEVHPHA